ncbi:efflux RND transporter periplasmic adaptor subunit [Oxalobacteraceae bacterium A2-2]
MKIETLPLAAPASAHATHARRWRAPLLAVTVLSVLAGGWAWLHRPAATAPAPAAASKEVAPVFELASGDVAAIATRSLALSLPLSGSLTPLSSATIKSKVSGQVEFTAVREGMRVQQGQVLARIDQADLRARLTQQQAALDEAQARLAMASKNEANSAALLKQKYISQTAYDTTQNAVDLARASVKSAAAQVEIARIALDDGVIRAPLSGVVSKRHVQPGEKLAPDMPVYTIVNLSELVLEAQVPAAEIPRVKVDQDVRFRVDGFPGRDFHGKVARINPTTEAGSRAMLVYISVPNEEGVLLGGMFAKGSIVTERSAEKPLLPLAALRGTPERPLVHKIEHGQVVAQPVTLGLRNEDEGLAEVNAGLQAGDQVIIARLDSVKPGSRVKLPAASAAAPAKG